MASRASVLCALAALGGLGSPGVAVAQGAREWRLTSFHAEIEVFQSGDILVTETLMPRFDGHFNGIYRSIPVEYRDPRGFRFKLRLDVESVEDGAGTALRHEVRRDGAYQKIKIFIPGAVDATRTVVLRYRVPNGFDSSTRTQRVTRSGRRTTSCTGTSPGPSGPSRSIARRRRYVSLQRRPAFGRTRLRGRTAP